MISAPMVGYQANSSRASTFRAAKWMQTWRLHWKKTLTPPKETNSFDAAASSVRRTAPLVRGFFYSHSRSVQTRSCAPVCVVHAPLMRPTASSTIGYPDKQGMRTGRKQRSGPEPDRVCMTGGELREVLDVTESYVSSLNLVNHELRLELNDSCEGHVFKFTKEENKFTQISDTIYLAVKES